MDVALLLVRNQGEKRRFPLPNDVITIGRREDCDLRIPLGDVSRKHCSLLKSGERLLLQDLGSSNGTFVNGQRVQEIQLKPGDQLGIGSLRFVVQIDGIPDESEAGDITVPAAALSGESGDLKADPLNPTAQMDPADLGLDPSDSAKVDDLMHD